MGENVVDIPEGLGQVISSDKTIKTAHKALIIKNSEGAMNQLKTAYPVVR